MDGVWTLLLFAVCFLTICPAFADDGPNLKKGQQDPGNDAGASNMFSVRQDYFKRFPFAKVAEAVRAGGRTKDDSKEQVGSTYTLDAIGETLTIPGGEILMQQTGPVKSKDPYFSKRPLYRPLYSYCGGIPGAFMPGAQPGMQGTFVPNYSKAAQGEGGNVIVKTPLLPICYQQKLELFDDSANMAQEGDQAIFEYELTTFGVGPISDTQFQMIDREDNQRFLELMFDPERWLWAGKAAGIMQQQQMGTSLANTADRETNTAYATVSDNLINVANEDAATPVSGSPAKKTKQQVNWMVQKMYKQVFLPMAILLLLPGAVMTQMKGMVQSGILGSSGDDTQSPFSGIIRSIIAIFLIPATQLIVSYMIDVGNSMSNETKKWVDIDTILSYAHEQEFGPQRDMTLNCLQSEKTNSKTSSETDSSVGIGGIDSDAGEDEFLGKAYGGKESKAIEEKMPQLSKQMQDCYNFFNCAASLGLVVLADFQWVMMSYLFLMGPIAGAFYAWPQMTKSLFNKVFSNWIEAVITLSLWRFWWNVVLACMTTYVAWEKDQGWYDPTSTWEEMVFSSFQVLMLVVPFAPFDFKGAADKSIDKIQEQSKDKVGKGKG